MALKNGKKVILLDFDPGDIFDSHRDEGLLITAGTPEKAIQLIKEFCSVV